MRMGSNSITPSSPIDYVAGRGERLINPVNDINGDEGVIELDPIRVKLRIVEL